MNSQTWEYTTVRFGTKGGSAKLDWEKLDEVIQRYGAEYWELVSSESLNGMHGQTIYVLLIFKRPIAVPTS